MYVPEVPRRRRPVLVRRRAVLVRRAGRQEVATGNLRDPRELATGHHLHHPCPSGCLSPTQVVAGPANPIEGPSPRPAGPGRTSRSKEASVDRHRRRTGHSCEPDWPKVPHDAGEVRFRQFPLTSYLSGPVQLNPLAQFFLKSCKRMSSKVLPPIPGKVCLNKK